MSMSDPIADFLTRIRNANMRNHPLVQAPFSRLKRDMAEVMKAEGFIAGWEQDTDERGHQRITLALKYDEEGERVIRGLKRISTPGLRRTAGYQDLKPVLNGQGIAIITTSKGVISDVTARQEQVGGEVLCHIW